jgi:hypothetical protein
MPVAGRSEGKDDGGRTPPVVAAVQKDFGGKCNGHLILLELPAPTEREVTRRPSHVWLEPIPPTTI